MIELYNKIWSTFLILMIELYCRIWSLFQILVLFPSLMIISLIKKGQILPALNFIIWGPYTWAAIIIFGITVSVKYAAVFFIALTISYMLAKAYGILKVFKMGEYGKNVCNDIAESGGVSMRHADAMSDEIIRNIEKAA